MIKAIIFDKDGTLLDFDSFWVTVSESVIKKLLKELNRTDISAVEFLNAIGVKNGVTDIDGILCKGTYKQITDAFNQVLKKYGCNKFKEQEVIDSYNQCSCFGEIKPTCENIRETLLKLKENGIKLAVVTTDNYEITNKCLVKLEIEDLFDKVYVDDGKTPVKPNPHCIFDFSEFVSVAIDEIIMVGDTMTDIAFARNAGISVIGVGSTIENRQQLANYANNVISDISDIFEFIREDK